MELVGVLYRESWCRSAAGEAPPAADSSIRVGVETRRIADLAEADRLVEAIIAEVPRVL